MSIGNVNMESLLFIAKAISMIDNVELNKEALLHVNNPYWIRESRRNLIKVLHSCGYNIDEEYKLKLIGENGKDSVGLVE